MTRTVLAAVLQAPGKPLVLEELTLDDPGPGEVLVRIAASGVCRSDLHQADGDWGDDGPMVLGHEGAGFVEEVGEGVWGLERGQLVGLDWFYPCLACERCLLGRQWECTGTNAGANRLPDGRTPLRRPDGSEVVPMNALGTFSERVVVPVQAAVPIPEGVTPEVVALIGCGVTTGVMSVLRTAAVPAGSSVLVIGLGGVGLSIVMGAVIAGATTIVAMDTVSDKLERAKELGATHVMHADTTTTADAVANEIGGGVDYAFEAIGLTQTLELAIEALAPGGTAVAVGIPRLTDRASFNVAALVDKNARIVGSNYGSSIPAVDFPRLAKLCLAGKLPVDRLIERRIRLQDVNDALAAMRRSEGLRRVIVF